MAMANSLIPSATMRDTLKKVITPNIGGSSPDSLFVALFNNSLTAIVDTDPSQYGTGPYASNEVTGTGWVAGGVALSSVSMVLTTSTGITFSAGNVSQSGTTLTAVQGCAIYDSTLGTKNVFAMINFGGAYSTSSGTFGITWSGSGIWFITLHS